MKKDQFTKKEDKTPKKFFTVTNDTEADNAWTTHDIIKMKNFIEIPRFQELCEKYNIIPTYLLVYEYATYEPAIEYLRPKIEDLRLKSKKGKYGK